jgi:hypothetical protein
MMRQAFLAVASVALVTCSAFAGDMEVPVV